MVETIGSDPGSEQGMIARLRAGEDAAFQELVRANSGRMLAVARRILRGDEEAHDAVQDAFLRAFRALDRFEGQARLSTWLHRIVVNACLMRLRHRKRHPEQAIDDLLPSFDDTGHRLDPGPAWSEDACGLMETQELRKVVRDAIDRLPDSHRTILVLRDIEGVSTEEAALGLGIRPEAAKMRLHRARQALRTLLEPHFGEES
jgi:RNA polymerase sigma-70 factor (ECF subfamily)